MSANIFLMNSQFGYACASQNRVSIDSSIYRVSIYMQPKYDREVLYVLHAAVIIGSSLIGFTIYLSI